MIDMIAMPPVAIGQPVEGRAQDAGGETGHSGFAQLLAALGATRQQADVDVKDTAMHQDDPLKEEEPDNKAVPMEAQGLAVEMALFQSVPLEKGADTQSLPPNMVSEPAGFGYGYHLTERYPPVNELPGSEVTETSWGTESDSCAPEQASPDAAQTGPDTAPAGFGAAQADRRAVIGGPGAVQTSAEAPQPVLPGREARRVATAVEDKGIPARVPQPPLSSATASRQSQNIWPVPPKATQIPESLPDGTGAESEAARLASISVSTIEAEISPPSLLPTEQALDTQRADFPERLAETVAKNTGEGCSEFDITLYPKQLGKVTVNVRLEQGSAVLSFLCETTSAQRVLNAHAADIGALVQQHVGQETVIEVPHARQQSQNPGDFEGRGEKQQGRQQHQHKKQSLELFIDQLKSAQITA